MTEGTCRSAEAHFISFATAALMQAMMLGLPSLPRNVSSRVKVQGSRFRDTSNSLPRSFEDIWTFFDFSRLTSRKNVCDQYRKQMRG